ncbi:MAG: YkgJ family cysteine cluster protein [Bacteroidetes bacterium]|nr:YkgJ family cysteine cluster protein [Bacteroidota bacterium]MBU1718085.1 YkgJ family cysteine cluster protein [Bacteroidota bacterium]
MIRANRSNVKELASNREASNREFLIATKKNRPPDFFKTTQSFHNKVFREIDCLDCANCCTSISPIITNRDIRRIAKHQGMGESEFSDLHIVIDSDGDLIFNATPCPFLLSDNKCLIYAARPEACATYPHTESHDISRIRETALKNSFVCPAVFEILEKLKSYYSKK